MKLPARPRLALPFTILSGAGSVTLVAGEDHRYTLERTNLEVWAPAFLASLQGRTPLPELLAALPAAHRDEARALVEALAGERALAEGTAADAHRPARWRARVRGTGPLRAALEADLKTELEAAPELTIFCQDRLDLAEAREIARAARAEGRALLWATVAPLARAYVSPVFLPDAGACLDCLLDNFERRSPVPGLHAALSVHAAAGGALVPAPAAPGALSVLRGLVAWKLDQLAQSLPAAELYMLHVLECATFEVSAHAVLRDPACATCGA